MTYPVRRKAQQLAAEACLPEDDWHARRLETIKNHEESVKNSMQALRSMGSVILAGQISTDLFIESTGPNMENTQASEKLGHISCQVIPALRGSWRRNRLPGLGFSWSPDIALQLDFVFEDKYDYSEKDRRPVPTGNVKMTVNHRSWGKISAEEIQEIEAIGENTWAKYTDQGFHRSGTNITTMRKSGEIIAYEEAEAMLAPLSTHVINYFDLIDRPELAAHQRPGNFSELG